MADTKISALPAVTTPLGGDEFAVNQGGTSKKETGTQIAAAIFLFDDVKWQNATDSLTGFQILDNDGGVPIFNVDTINERVSIGGAAPEVELDVEGTIRAEIASQAGNVNVYHVDHVGDISWRNANLGTAGLTLASGSKIGFNSQAGGGVDGANPGNNDITLSRPSAGVLQIQDVTPTTGDTSVVIKEGAAKALNLLEFQANNGDLGWLFASPVNLIAGRAVVHSIRAFGGTTGEGIRFNSVSAFVKASGEQKHIFTASAFAPGSGTSTYVDLELAPVINQTGGANGITRGLYVNPTLTAAADFRAIEVTLGGFLTDSGLSYGLGSGYAFGDKDMQIYESADDDLHIWGGDVSIIDPNDLAAESLTDPADFTDDADWDFTGEVAAGVNAVFTFSSTGAGTITQTNGAMAIVGVNSRWYKAVYIVSSSTVADAVMTITSAFALTAVTLSTADGTHTIYFKSAVAADAADFVIDITGATAGAFTLESITVKEVTGGDLMVTGDINTVPWQDYGASSTIGGFSSVTTANIWVKKVGNLVFVTYYILGVSNANTFTFTVPFTSVNSANSRNYTAAQVQNNSVTLLPPGMCLMNLNSNMVSLFIDFGGTVWITSNNKHARGQFVYEAQ